MLKNLPKTSHNQVVCEANYLRLRRLLGSFTEKEYFFEGINPDSSMQNISFLILDKTKHTVIIEAKQINAKNISINDFICRIRVSLDACLAEAISYQGERALPSFFKKSQIQSYDEKEQQNRFFTEWLESIFITGIAKADNIKNIIRND
ncbi:DUF1249 domain-containing protein [Gammaproteobacteria bacterium]|jgi:uncharacterized protein|nr:DUF1249 domain-containing protein [Gammaproteobacteria bacterium]MDA7856491.1 DUF1249 domain-containing protein [Gammaproteobacteria bacterium]MDA8856622.1 DUF1249 domain-containing protein [Gammaproteobacteria bacterium]MDA9038792.1 DUF1249 domain-containing protein [Gammaproteobacteria bacterium]MDA9195593.1 DUF1249 domain-containing protein [Gammaproteobacteria bacterium]|tara:strand:- start:4901 stop:5347 length:447 start_codon:yes stop_codon:yes gene_type:complete